MRILGIDPGIAIVGFGLIESDRGNMRIDVYKRQPSLRKAAALPRLFSAYKGFSRENRCITAGSIL